DAVESYDKAIAIKPDWAEVHYNRGLILGELNCTDALASFDKALAIKPDYAVALEKRGSLLQNLGRPEEAIADYERALSIDTGLAYAHGQLVIAKMNSCNWRSLEPELERLRSNVLAGKRATAPFILSTVS